MKLITKFTASMILMVIAVAPTAKADIGDQLFKLIANDGAGGDYFGWSIAIDNGIVAVGAYLADDNGNASGSAYLFDASNGDQLLKLLPTDGSAGDQLGKSIAIDNGIVAVGAVHNDDNGSQSGSAYLFDASTGTHLFKLLPSDGAEYDRFGNSIAIDNGIVAVGAWEHADNGFASGSAYLFDASTGKQLFKLLPSDGAEYDGFGNSIAIDNGIVAVGAYLDNDNGSLSGSVYLFDASTGTQLFKLLPSDGAEAAWFGYSIAIDNGIVAVGEIWGDDNGSQSGSAYLFDASTGTQLFKLLPSDGAEYDAFGSSIAIDNGIVAVGKSWGDDNGSLSGSAYLFDASTGKQLFKLLPSDGAEYDGFGFSISIDNGIVAVGAHGDDDNNGFQSGSAYLFDSGYKKPIKCVWDLDGDGATGTADLLVLLGFWGIDPGGPPDFDGDGTVSTSDLLVLLANWGPCP